MKITDERWCVMLSAIERGDLARALHTLGGPLPDWVEDELRFMSKYRGKLVPPKFRSDEDTKLIMARSDYQMSGRSGEKASERLKRAAAANEVKPRSLKNILDGRGRAARRLNHTDNFD